jgi:predicted protein tyrosine phosphatase
MARDALMRITICGLAELAAHGADEVTHVLSILDPGWPDPQAFASFPTHRRIALRFHDVIAPLPGAIVPTQQDVGLLLAFGREVSAAGRDSHLLIHCHAGISRSTAAAALLFAQAAPARPVEDIFTAIADQRPRAWPNLLLLEFGERELGRPGEIVPAAVPQYRRVLEADPHFAGFITGAGRGREVELAQR